MAKAPPFPFDTLIEAIGTKFEDSIHIQVPLPPVELSPNRNFHFAVEGHHKREYRTECAWLAAKAVKDAGFSFKLAVISARFVIIDKCPIANEHKMATVRGKPMSIPVKYRPQDSMNGMAALKAAQDGFVDGGLCKNDSRHYVMQGPVIIERMTRTHALSRGFAISCVEMIVQGLRDG